MSTELTRKDLLADRIMKMQEMVHGPNQFSFLPVTMNLPKEIIQLEEEMKRNRN